MRGLPNQAKQFKRSASVAALKELEKRIRRMIDAEKRNFEITSGLKLSKVYKGPQFALPAFEGSWKVPMELLRLLLAGAGVDKKLTVAARHALLMPKALHAIGKDDEELSDSVWYQKLQPYQLDPMHALVRVHGYEPATTDTTLSKLLKLIRAGRETPQTVSVSIGTGQHRVSFSDRKTMRYRGHEHSVQWRGNSGRIKLDGKLVSIWVYLADSIAETDRTSVIKASEAAQAEVDMRQAAAVEKAQEQAQVDALDLPGAETPERASTEG
jgi:hypothetical protein